MATTLVARLVVTAMIALGALGGWPAGAEAQETIRIGCPTKTYFPTILATVAKEKGLFEKEGLRPEITIYRGGGETFEAIAANSADLGPVAVPLVATSRKRGVLTKIVGGNGDEWSGWILGVKTASPVKSAKELDGKKVGITSAGSASDIIARWTMADSKIKFTAVPLGGGGLVPNMLSGNVDAIVLYSPLSFKVLQEKTGRALIDYGQAMPEHLSGVWIASDKVIKEKPAMVQKAVNALFGAMTVLKNDKAGAIKLIAEVDEIPPQIAEAELEGNILKLSTDGEMKKEWVQRGLDMAKLVGMSDLAPIDQIYTEKFKAVPTK